MRKNVVCTKGASEFKIGQEYVLVDSKGHKTIGGHTCYVDAEGVLTVDIGKERAHFEEIEEIEINQLPANSHYFIDVSEHKTIDVYAICKLYNLQDSSGALHHALKKILCPGKRSGGKSQMRDIKEAIASLNRFVDLHDSKE